MGAMRTLLQLIVTGLAVATATWLVPGIVLAPGDTQQQLLTISLVAVLMALVNLIVKPVMKFLTGCLIILTLGLFLWVVNAVMLMLVSWACGQFGIGWSVADWPAAFLGALVISLVTALLAWVYKRQDD